MEQLDYNLLYRWFVGLTPDDAVWDPTVFTKNRDRLLAGNIAEAFFDAVLNMANAQQLLSHEHFTVDGTLLEAWASHKSFRPMEDPSPPPSDGDPSNPSVNFRGEKRSNTTHRSGTDPATRPWRGSPCSNRRDASARWARTRATIRPASSPTSAPWASRRT